MADEQAPNGGIPENWKRTKRPPVVVDGYEFLSYHTGIMRYHLHCAAINAMIRSNFNLSGYDAYVDGIPVKSPRTGKPHRFKTEQGAIDGAIAEARKRI